LGLTNSHPEFVKKGRYKHITALFYQINAGYSDSFLSVSSPSCPFSISVGEASLFADRLLSSTVGLFSTVLGSLSASPALFPAFFCADSSDFASSLLALSSVERFSL